MRTDLICDGKEPLSSSTDRRRELSVGRNIGVTVKQVFSRNANIVEAQLGVVHPVETHLVTHVLDRHTRNGVEVVIATPDKDSVDALVFAVDNELKPILVHEIRHISSTTSNFIP